MDRLAAMDAFIRVVDSGSFSGAAVSLNSFKTKLPFWARPGPLAGNLSSGNTSRRMAVMSFSLLVNVTV